MSKVVSPAALVALREALSGIYWYKRDLRSFLTASVSNPAVLARLNWDDNKRDIVSVLVEHMARNERKYHEDLLALISATVAVDDYSHLERLEDGKAKASAARQAVAALRKQAVGYLDLERDRAATEERRRTAQEDLRRLASVRDRLAELNRDFVAMISSPSPQARGYDLEELLRSLFELFDLDPKAAFKVTGEQIDGAFSFEGTDYLLEAKWQQAPVIAADLDALDAKIGRKLDNTLALFVSINGFSADGVTAYMSGGRRHLILMDGSDLMAVLDGRIGLADLLLRKRRYAAQTGGVYLKVTEIL